MIESLGHKQIIKVAMSSLFFLEEEYLKLL